MIIETGHFALILALAVACLQTGSVVWASYAHDEKARAMAPAAAITQFVLLAAAFGALVWAYAGSDFSVENVWRNSHSAKPLIYKISGTWGNHEGSMVLWVLILAAFGAAVALFGHNLPDRLKSNVLAVQGSIGIAFLAFIVATSNPFARLDPAPFEGNGLNPILQDPGLAFHPPLLYAGYVGLSMAYSFAVAALIEGRISAAWARWVRPWTLAAWIFLTLGIATGSWWAYYELGWGGWWFWDPVENASFVPWLAATALLHSAIVTEKREALKAWTVLLAIIAFALSLIGTFIVRSGVLTSVHAFAVDPARGVFVLLIIALFAGTALGLFAWRAPLLRSTGLFAPISREGSLLLNNLLLTAACGTVLTGTLAPMVLEALGHKISVGAPYYDTVFPVFMIPLLIVVPFGPFLAWKRGDIYGVGQRLMAAAALGILAMAVSVALTQRGPVLAPFGIGLGVWVIAGALSEMAFRVKAFAAPWGEVRRRLAGLPRSNWGTAAAHIGLGLAVLGIVATSAWKTEQVLTMKIGQKTQFAGYELVFERVGSRDGPNYNEQFGVFALMKAGSPDRITTLTPAKRQYIQPRMPTTETAIHLSWAGDFYVALGDPSEDGKAVAVRIYFHPLVRLIWIGALIMAIGGGISLSDRRLRVGAPARRSREPGTMTAAGQPS